MAGKMRRGLLALCCLVCCLAFGVVPARAASGVKELCTYATETKTVRADVTGNGKKDTIRLKLTMGQYNGTIKESQVYVNGKKALTVNDTDDYRSVSMRHVRMSKSKVFLQISTHGDSNYKHFNRIYRYDKKKKKLVCVLDLFGEPDIGGTVVKASSKGIQVSHGLRPRETGGLAWNYTYTYKNGKFKLKSSTAAVKSTLGNMAIDDEYKAIFAKNKYVVASTRVFYKDTNLKKASFTAKQNDKLTLKKIKIAKGKVYLQFQKGKKTGWQQVNGTGFTEWFYGVSKRQIG